MAEIHVGGGGQERPGGGGEDTQAAEGDTVGTKEIHIILRGSSTKFMHLKQIILKKKPSFLFKKSTVFIFYSPSLQNKKDYCRSDFSLAQVQKFLRQTHHEQVYYDEEAPLHLAAYCGYNDLVQYKNSHI